MFSKALLKLPLPLPVAERPPPLSSGLEILDGLLGGGLPRGQLMELSGDASSGKSTRAFAACLQALAQGSAAFWIEARSDGRFWPICALEAEISLERFFLLRVPDGPAALRGAHLLLTCAGACALAVVELPRGFVPKPMQLVQLQRLAEKSGAVVLFLTEQSRHGPSLGTMVSLRLHVRRLTSAPARAPLPASQLAVEVLRHKGGPTQTFVEESLHGPNRLRLHSSL